MHCGHLSEQEEEGGIENREKINFRIPNAKTNLRTRTQLHLLEPFVLFTYHPMEDFSSRQLKIFFTSYLVSGLEELCPTQPEPERVLHQATQGPWPPGKGTLLDDRPGARVHVRGGILQEEAEGVQEEGAEGFPVRTRRGVPSLSCVLRRFLHRSLWASPSNSSAFSSSGCCRRRCGCGCCSKPAAPQPLCVHRRLLPPP